MSTAGVFEIERSALRHGCHDIPDIEKRVFTRADNKRTFAKASSSLATTINIDTAAEMWREACSSIGLRKTKGKEKSRQAVDLRLSDDVSSYVCGINYYNSLLEMQKRTGRRDVVFFHVLSLETEG